MEISVIHRGDQINCGSKAEIYRSAGLIAKQISNGDPKYVERVGLLESIRAHIKPESYSESEFRDKSSFISFSSSTQIAAKFASYNYSSEKCFPKDLVSCQDYYERRYIFHMDISTRKTIPSQLGLYKLEFKCLQNNKFPDSPSDEILFNYFSNEDNSRCEICQINNGYHIIYLIDVISFLNSNLNKTLLCKYHKAYDNAARDKEWLVMPADFLIRLRGNSSFIPRANLWYAEHFILKNEQPRDPEEFKLGQYNFKSKPV